MALSTSLCMLRSGQSESIFELKNKPILICLISASLKSDDYSRFWIYCSINFSLLSFILTVLLSATHFFSIVSSISVSTFLNVSVLAIWLSYNSSSSKFKCGIVKPLSSSCQFCSRSYDILLCSRLRVIWMLSGTLSISCFRKMNYSTSSESYCLIKLFSFLIVNYFSLSQKAISSDNSFLIHTCCRSLNSLLLIYNISASYLYLIASAQSFNSDLSIVY